MAFVGSGFGLLNQRRDVSVKKKAVGGIRMTLAPDRPAQASERERSMWAERATPMYNLTEEEKYSAMVLPGQANNFSAKYVAFDDDDDSEYSLDQVVYRAKKGGLLEVRQWY